MLPPSLKTERAKLADFYAARSEAIPPLPWQTFPPPFSRAWIVQKLGHHAATYMSQLQFLIDAPETRALLAAAPPEALKPLGRTLRPLARLLGVDLPSNLRLPPRPPRIRPPRPTPPIQPPEPPSPHTLWRSTHRRGLPPPLYPSLHAPRRRQARI